MHTIGFRPGLLENEMALDTPIPIVDFQHILCIGTTGTGKTASLILPTLADRMQRGHTIIFFDHKGHEHQKVKALAEEAGRLYDVIEIGKPHSSYINLMEELDTIRLKELIQSTAGHKDPYWENSAANLLEDIIIPLRKLYKLLGTLKPYSQFDGIRSTIVITMQKVSIDILTPPSFQTLAALIHTPRELKAYVKIMTEISSKLDTALQKEGDFATEGVSQRRMLQAEILMFKESIKALGRFELEEEGGSGTGNNGVFQVLNNAIASYAKKDYINRDECDIVSLMSSNAILIIDTQSFGGDILKLLLESILKKSVMRLRTGTQKPMSVFIDEANRVLFPSIDLHSDVLREAEVELIIAIQNEEQMKIKFSELVWESIRSNIKHQYRIGIDHAISYNGQSQHIVEPLLMQEERLMEAEQHFYGLEKNRANIQKNFLGSLDTLPEHFTVRYDLDHFEHASAIILNASDGSAHEVRYYGEKILKEAESMHPHFTITIPESHRKPLLKEDSLFDEITSFIPAKTVSGRNVFDPSVEEDYFTVPFEDEDGIEYEYEEEIEY